MNRTATTEIIPRAGASWHQSDKPMTFDEIEHYAPSAFSEIPSDIVSDRFGHVRTFEILKALRRKGWETFFAAQSATLEEENRKYAKHMLRLRHGADIEKYTGQAQELIIVNASDLTTPLIMTAGWLEFVCMNGLITGSGLTEFRIRHRGEIENQVIEAAHRILNGFVDLEGLKDRTMRLVLEPWQARVFAEQAIDLRWNDKTKLPPVVAAQLLEARYEEQNTMRLWDVYNTIQGNMTRGLPKSERGVSKATQPITAVNRTLKINMGLWKLTEQMLIGCKG